MLYVIHIQAHRISYLKKYHFDHHKIINISETKWHWNNLLLYNDTYKSTVDLWLTEVLPTLIFSILTEQYWIFVFYYLWAALIQERIEHNKNFNLPILTSGKWHLQHHLNGKVNYGLFIPVWDIVFNTYRHS